ncbi:MAG: stage II sporulation protein D [Clostridiales bacterium]|nr:stage II sporulation protein D [Clostridiales bacterium]
MKKILTHILFIISIVVLVPTIILKGYSGDCVIKSRYCKKIDVYYKKDDKIVYLPLEEYIKCVVAKEMPALFEIEALKAQAIAVRTFVYKKMSEEKSKVHKGATVCTDFAHCQAYAEKDAILVGWEDDAEKNWDKISKAVDETTGKVVCYDNELILPLFHSNSTGLTESSKEIWSSIDIPYLRSVESFGTEDVSYVRLSVDEFKKKILHKYPNIKFSSDVFSDIKEIERNESDRVRHVKISENIIKGEVFREIFSLKSTNFKLVNIGNNKIEIKVYGSGHGVGLCQVGANEMAKRGKKFDDILKHYYGNINIVNFFDK